MASVSFLGDLYISRYVGLGSWAAESPDDSTKLAHIALPTAPRPDASIYPGGGSFLSSGGYGRDYGFHPIDMSKLPTEGGPFLAFVGNLPYDIESSDEIYSAIENAEGVGPGKIVRLNLPKSHDEPNRFRGFGYIEFKDLNSLKAVLALNGILSIRDRKVRFDIAESSKGTFSGGDRGFGSSGFPGASMDKSEWRRAAPMDDQELSGRSQFATRSESLSRDGWRRPESGRSDLAEDQKEGSMSKEMWRREGSIVDDSNISKTESLSNWRRVESKEASIEAEPTRTSKQFIRTSSELPDKWRSAGVSHTDDTPRHLERPTGRTFGFSSKDSSDPGTKDNWRSK